jgi:hypothetical protein
MMQTHRTQEQTANGWTEHQNPQGFSLVHPDGWTVETPEPQKILVRSAYPGLFVFVHAFTAAGGAAAWISQIGSAYADIFPNARIEKTQNRAEGELLGELLFQGVSYTAKANFLCVADGDSGMFYATAAPQTIFAQWRPALVHILQSLRFTPPQEVPAPPALPGTNPIPPTAATGSEWERFVDPVEQAFRVEVPRGWQVSGGLFRVSMMDVRSELRMASPDSRIHIFSGDRNIPTFALPSQIGMSLGFVEGSPYSPAVGSNMIIYGYRPGAIFAQEYVQTAIAQQFGGAQITGGQQRSDLTQQANQNAMQGHQQAHVGEVAFETPGGNRGTSRKGYCLAHTVLTGSAEAGIWNVLALYGYVADADKETTARTVLDHLVRSSQVNPQWQAQQQVMSQQGGQMARQQQQWEANQYQQMRQTQQETSDIINQSFHDRWAAQDERNRHFGNALMGQTDVQEVSSGEAWRVSSGSNYYWRQNGTNRIVGTNTYDRPDIDFTPLKEF